MASFMLLLGFYLGGFFYVSMLVWDEAIEEGFDEDISTIIMSGAVWPYGLCQILSGKA